MRKPTNLNRLTPREQAGAVIAGLIFAASVVLMFSLAVVGIRFLWNAGTPVKPECPVITKMA